MKRGKSENSYHGEMCMCGCNGGYGKWMGVMYIIGGLVAVGFYLGRIDMQTAAGLLGLGLLAKGIWKLSNMSM